MNLRALSETFPASHPVRRVVGAVAMALALVTVAPACGSTGPSDGPIINVCGTHTGRATSTSGDGPIYVDAARHPSTAPIYATVHSAPITIRVSQDCADGASVRLSAARVIKLQGNFKAKDGAVEAAVVYPIGIGRVTLTAARRDARPITVTFAIVSLARWCRATGNDTPSSAKGSSG